MSSGNSNKGPLSDVTVSTEDELRGPTRLETTLVLINRVSLTLHTDSLIVSDERSKHSLIGSLCGACGIRCSKSPRQKAIPVFNVLWAEVLDGYITVRYAEPTSKHDFALDSVNYPVDTEQRSAAVQFAEKLLSLAYGESQRRKRIKVLVNPFGGKGHAPKLYRREVEPILSAARCDVDVEETTHQGHAEEIAENIDFHAYDVIAPCSGDGLVFEVFNGLSKKSNATEALANIAVSHIPCGSGNAMSWNLHGTGSVSMAALCIVKGLKTPLDLVSVTQGSRRNISFLSQSFGIVAESDLGTEHLRWMGSARFTYGFLVRLIGENYYPCDLAVKVEIDDKQQIKEHYKKKIQQGLSGNSRGQFDEVSGLPELKYGTVKDPLPEGWELVPHETLGNFYCGNMAFMSPDAIFFPTALPNDGLLDLIMINADVGRRAALQMLGALEDGSLFDIPEVSVRKVSAYRIIPRHKEGYISIDGESFPFEPYQVEVHRGLGTVLSRSGYKYEANVVA